MIDPAKCRECDKVESRLQLELLGISCKSAGVDPCRAAVSVSELVNVVTACEKYLYQFDEIMIGVGKAKKEGLDVTGIVDRIQDIQLDLLWRVKFARLKVGGVQYAPTTSQDQQGGEVKK